MEEQRAFEVHPHLATRLAVGLAQGIVLYLLTEAIRAKAWPASEPMARTALWNVFLYVPLLFQQGLGIIRLPRLLAWCAVATATVAALSAYGAWRQTEVGTFWWDGARFALSLFMAAGLFIAHALIEGGDIDRRFMAHYPTHFDVAWKMALQLILVALFEGAFWLLLWLGAALFELLGLSFLRHLITHDWFVYPATALVVAGGIHLTDVQPGLVRGMRGLVLVLFSWLLPLLTLLAVGFLAALPFTGLHPLWRWGHASAEMLVAAALLIILINAMYQDGESDRPVLLRYSGMAAALSLLPLVGLAAYALSLRVGQYGWTTDRVATAACVVVAGFYAIGYLASLLMPLFDKAHGPLKLIAPWNFAASLLVLAVLLALFSPLADPARIAVDSQLARLESGKVRPDKFDFRYLRSDSYRFGIEALARLARSTNPQIARLAGDAQKNRLSAGRVSDQRPLDVANDMDRVQVYPKGKMLPNSFRTQKWDNANGGFVVSACVRPFRGFVPAATPERECDAVLSDFDGDGKDEILLLNGSRGSGGNWGFFGGNLFRQGADGIWTQVAILTYPHCGGDFEALLDGKFTLAPTARSDLMIQGRRIRLNWTDGTDTACPK